MLQQLRIATTMLLVLTVLAGVVYPLCVTSIAQIAFPAQANGSLIHQGAAIRGSEMIGQNFTRPEYFWSRLSATSPVPYNAAASSGSNLGPSNPALVEAARTRVDALKASGIQPANIPVDLATSSASGLDPHISPAAAEIQVARVAAARHLDETKVRELVGHWTQGRQLGVLGELRVNVLRLNLELDELSPGSQAR
jgi:K+-transporting ATPase ATPase C chain